MDKTRIQYLRNVLSLVSGLLMSIFPIGESIDAVASADHMG